MGPSDHRRDRRPQLYPKGRSDPGQVNNSYDRNQDWRTNPALPPKLHSYNFNISVSELVKSFDKYGKEVRWPRKSDKPDARKDMNRWCEFHGDHGHSTDECIALRKEVARLLSQGLLRDVISDRAKATLDRKDQVSSKKPSSPVPTKVVNTISGGSDVCGNTYSAAKRHARESRGNRPTPSEIKRPSGPSDPIITFDDSEAQDLGDHHDGLVISLSISNCLIRRVLIDTGSSTNLLTLDALKGMGLSEDDLTRNSTPLVGFSGEVKYTLGEVVLTMYAGGVNQQVKFLILDFPSPYNAILGRPWIHAMKAVPSTYHQTIKFPTKWGVQEIKGDQRAAKECYVTSMKGAVDKTSA